MRGGSVRQDRHLRRYRRTAVPYAQFDSHYPAGVCPLSRVLPTLQAPPAADAGPQKTHRSMLDSCCRLARGSRAEP